MSVAVPEFGILTTDFTDYTDLDAAEVGETKARIHLKKKP
jgi:hypothetical protein